MPKVSKRNGYYYRNGKEYPSVTKILGDTLSKPALLYWYGQQSARIALKNPELTEKEVMAELQLTVKQSQERGKYIHCLVETMPNVDESKVNVEYINYFKALKLWWDLFEPKDCKHEVECYSDIYGFACRYDMSCMIRGERWILDFKTNEQGTLYKEVGLQLAANKQAACEGGELISKTGCVVLSGLGEPVFKETNDTINDFINVKKVWEWKVRRGE